MLRLFAHCVDGTEDRLQINVVAIASRLQVIFYLMQEVCQCFQPNACGRPFQRVEFATHLLQWLRIRRLLFVGEKRRFN